MLTAVTNAITTVIGWVGTVIDALLGTATEAGGVAGTFAPLLPLFAIGVAISGILLAVRIIRSFIWGA